MIEYFLELFSVVILFLFASHPFLFSLHHFTFGARAKTSNYSNNRKIIIDKFQLSVLFLFLFFLFYFRFRILFYGRRNFSVCRSNSNSIHLFSYFCLIASKWRVKSRRRKKIRSENIKSFTFSMFKGLSL